MALVLTALPLKDSKKTTKETDVVEGETKNSEAQIYSEARSYIVVEVSLGK